MYQKRSCLSFKLFEEQKTEISDTKVRDAGYLLVAFNAWL